MSHTERAETISKGTWKVSRVGWLVGWLVGDGEFLPGQTRSSSSSKSVEGGELWKLANMRVYTLY